MKGRTRQLRELFISFSLFFVLFLFCSDTALTQLREKRQKETARTVLARFRLRDPGRGSCDLFLAPLLLLLLLLPTSPTGQAAPRILERSRRALSASRSAECDYASTQERAQLRVRERESCHFASIGTAVRSRGSPQSIGC